MPFTNVFPVRMERLGRFFRQGHCIKDTYEMPLYPQKGKDETLWGDKKRPRGDLGRSTTDRAVWLTSLLQQGHLAR